MVHFDHPPNTGHDDKFEIVGAAYRLRQSPCYLESKGRLTCTTCHDPHKIVRGAPAVARQRQVCQQCHASAHHPESDCATCHMPKRRTEDAVQVIMTDHRIQRHKPKGDLLAPLHETDTYRGDLRSTTRRLPDKDKHLLGLALMAITPRIGREASLSSNASQKNGARRPQSLGLPWRRLHGRRRITPPAIRAYAAALQVDPGRRKPDSITRRRWKK